MRVIDRATRIAPFGDAVGDLSLFDRPFTDLRTEEVQASGVPPNRLTFADYAFASAPLIAALARESGDAAAGAPGPVALALPASSPSRHLCPVSSVRRVDELLVYDVFLDAPADADLETLRETARPVVVELPWQTRRRELHRVGPPPHHIDLPGDGVVAAHVEHWVHVLWLAPLLVPAVLSRAPGKRRRRRKEGAASVIGDNVKIHPTAYLEGAIIGDGARIGAGCTIRHSHVGAGSHLSDFTKVSWSVLGRETHTLADATFSSVVAFGRGTLANLLLRDVVLGHQVFLTTGVIFWNEGIEKTIRVEHQGELVDTGYKNLGGCAGHGCVLGARTIVAPGRALPNRTTVVMRKEEGMFKVEDAPPGTAMCGYDGALVPVERVLDGPPDELEGDRREHVNSST